MSKYIKITSPTNTPDRAARWSGGVPELHEDQRLRLVGHASWGRGLTSTSRLTSLSLSSPSLHLTAFSRFGSRGKVNVLFLHNQCRRHIVISHMCIILIVIWRLCSRSGSPETGLVFTTITINVIVISAFSCDDFVQDLDLPRLDRLPQLGRRTRQLRLGHRGAKLQHDEL